LRKGYALSIGLSPATAWTKIFPVGISAWEAYLVSVAEGHEEQTRCICQE